MPNACRPDAILRALEAALEVNEHLRQDVEAKGSTVQDLKQRLAAQERRYEQLSQRVRAQGDHDDPDVSQHVAVVVRSPKRTPCRAGVTNRRHLRSAPHPPPECPA